MVHIELLEKNAFDIPYILLNREGWDIFDNLCIRWDWKRIIYYELLVNKVLKLDE